MKKHKLPPGPKTRIPLGHLPGFRKDIIGFLEKTAKSYGDIAYFRIGPIRIVLLNHPDHIREVLSVQHEKFVKGRPLEMAKQLIGESILTSEGEFHKRQARIIQPAFHRKKVESYAPVITDCAKKMMSTWEDGIELDVKDEMTKMSSIMAGKIMFHVDIEKDSEEIIQALDTATALFGRISIPFSEWLLKLPLPGSIRFHKAKARLDKLIFGMIEDRKKNTGAYDDLLSLLLNPYDDKDGYSVMSDEQVRDEALTLFLTAFDTTSTAITWAWYLLSQNSQAEAEFHQELDRELEGRTPTVEDIPKLSYTRKVMTESMRLFPPTYVLPRQSIEDFEIGDYVIPKGSMFLMSQYLIHRDGRFYEDPEAFNPHRWDSKEPQRYEYFPFSGGPRTCIGEPLAWMEGVLALATVGQSWQLKLVPDHPVEMLPLINLRPKYGMLMTVHKRNE